jgi:hypothetical protein
MGGPSAGAGLNPYMFPQQQPSTGLAPGMPQPRAPMGQMGQPPGFDIQALVQRLLASRLPQQGMGQSMSGSNPMSSQIRVQSNSGNLNPYK